ncbi:MAG TPA: hypothetical protein VHC47_14405 [Mucilaginibacter sp.]|nr:hypothetical protein [Mucilaginibacter sp.]
MRKYLLPVCVVFFICTISVNAFPQDTTKKAAHTKTTTKPVNRPERFHQVGPVQIKSANTTTPSGQAKVNPKRQIDPTQLNDKSLAGQYGYLLSKTYNYEQPLMGALWKNFMDTLNHERQLLRVSQAKLTAQNKVLDSLKADIASKDQSLSESSAKVDAISVLGMLVSKSTYNIVMFSLVGILILALVIVLSTTAKYKHDARYRMNLYEEIEEEYKTFKAKANEKEIKLARELQTERNKLDELLGRG